MKRYDPFEELKILLLNIKRAEQENLSSFLTAFDTNATKTFNKSAELVKLIFEKPGLSEKEAIKTLQLSSDKYNFNKFISRLKDKVLESLLLDVNINRKGEYSDSFKAKTEVEKKLMYAPILVAKSMRDSAVKLVTEAVSKAKKYELFLEAAQGLRIIQSINGFDKGMKLFGKLEEEINFITECYQSINIAQKAYLSYFMFLQKKGLKEEQKSGYIKSLLKKIEVRDAFHLQNVNYYYLALQFELHKANSEYSEAKKLLLKIYYLLLDNIAIKNDERIGKVLTDISENELNLSSYKKASESFQKALRFYEKNSREHRSISQNLVKIKVFQKEIDEALALCNSLVSKNKNGKKGEKEEIVVEWIEIEYLKAICFAQQNNYAKSLEHLNRIRNQANLKEDTRFYIYLLEIIALAEKEKGNFGEQTLNYMSRIIDEISEFKLPRKRDKIIARILKKLKKSNFDFQFNYNKCRNDFNHLTNIQNAELRWSPVSMEVFLFDDWYMSYISNKNYHFKKPLKK